MTGCQCRVEGERLTPCRPEASSSLARFSTTLVTLVSAGPPFGGLYLIPPSSGGLCDGVITMPSASGPPFVVHRDGIGNGRRRGETVVFLHDNINAVGCQHFRTEIKAGSESAWVSYLRSRDR